MLKYSDLLSHLSCCFKALFNKSSKSLCFSSSSAYTNIFMFNIVRMAQNSSNLTKSPNANQCFCNASFSIITKPSILCEFSHNSHPSLQFPPFSPLSQLSQLVAHYFTEKHESRDNAQNLPNVKASGQIRKLDSFRLF